MPLGKRTPTRRILGDAIGVVNNQGDELQKQTLRVTEAWKLLDQQREAVLELGRNLKAQQKDINRQQDALGVVLDEWTAFRARTFWPRLHWLLTGR